MHAPRNKAESTDYFARGLYGNSIRQWANWNEALSATDYKGTFVIRYKGENGAQGPAIFDVPSHLLMHEWGKLLSLGWKRERLYVNEAIPKDRIIFQGELSTGNWADREWHLIGHEGPGIHMRDAMKLHDFERRGLMARLYLKEVMDSASWDDLSLIVDMWPEAVIELVALNTPIGRLAYTGRRCLVWEARTF